MKIALYIQHEGLLRMLLHLWEDHEVRIYSEWEGAMRLAMPPLLGDEDVIVSAIGHHELNWLNTDKPVIAYVTDPIYPPTAGLGFKYWLEQENFTVIGAEDCYPPEYVVPFSDCIPYTIGGYPPYNASINKVLIVSRKPDQRLMAVTREALHGKMYAEDKVYDLAKMMGDLPYVVAREADITKFRQMYADYKVLFYFSHSPFTVVMYEAMAVGMPVVAYNSVHFGWTSVIEKWFPKRSIYPEEISKMLKEELGRIPPGPAIYYGNPSFDEVKQRWNDLLESVK